LLYTEVCIVLTVEHHIIATSELRNHDAYQI
jgi:hypothetical protein